MMHWDLVSVLLLFLFYKNSFFPPCLINRLSYFLFRRLSEQPPLNGFACARVIFPFQHVSNPIYRITQRYKQDLRENFHTENSNASLSSINPAADGLLLIPDQCCSAGCTTSSVLVKIASLFLISLVLIGSAASRPALLLSNLFELAN